jgi:hypothetical protein
MSGGVFLRRGDDLVEMVEQPYDLEDHLQELIERHPNLLAGNQINPDAPRRWLMLSREAGIASEPDGNERWSVDHLLLDQDAIPTLVEVKRSSDSRIRREVVGQMLDYAANAVTYWNIDLWRSRYEEALQSRGEAPEDVIADLVGEQSVDYEEFWERVKTNLSAGRIRLVFVADTIPTELQRVVEFLNERMTPTEVLAVEIRQYVGSGEQMLVPRVVGQTVQAQRTKRRTDQKEWDETRFFSALAESADPAAVDAAREILRWAEARGLRIWWGKGALTGTLTPTLDHESGTHSYWLVRIWTGATLDVALRWLRLRPPFDTVEKRQEILQRLNAIDGIRIKTDKLDGQPTFPLAALTDHDALAAFLAVFEWFLAEAKAYQP